VKRAVALLALVTGCGHGSAPKFNAVDSRAATAPASAVTPPPDGHSDLTFSGELAYRTTTDFQCSYAVDDFFIRGTTGAYDGIPVYISVNVEFFKKPGRYAGKVQILVRRVSDDAQKYASWYDHTATATVHERDRGVDIEPVTLTPEAGTQATKPVTIGGHVGCLGPPKPGSG
jgi:hypothetical protein